MIVNVLKDYKEMSKYTAKFIIDYVIENPTAVLCLAGGDTPRKTYQYLVKAHEQNEVDFSACTFIGLDEFVGIGREEEGSCLHFLYDTLFTPIGVKEENIYFFDVKSSDLEKECKRIDEVISQKEKIDIIILGVGMNGHLGFNEPGISFDLFAHVVELSHTSKIVGQKYFKEARELDKGITLGITHILESKKAILIANGSKKATIVQKTIEEETTNLIPSTVIRIHQDSYVFIDEEAAANLMDFKQKHP
ncbi:glucosamine-6-phosphate deaminase [Neobacillus soli]|uniref:glucosamine-6-phosphate deaminase n=1 Tax=Neobacillus soli TaxID=220688 RepID=UPI0008268F09|nr:glucosamine-6-phosphate deaminase [Neobacillus soli]